MTMRHFFILLSTLFIALVMVVPVSAQKTYEVTASKLNVRSEAKKNGSVVGSVARGETVLVYGINGGWAEISYKGRTAYVSSQYLKAKSSSQRETTREVYVAPQRENTSRAHRSSAPVSSSVYSSGLGMSADLGLGYRSKVFSATFSYDIGYQLKRMLYFGAGPVVEGDFGNGGSAFSAGGHVKVLFIAPLKGNVAPMIAARVGYLYNFEAEDGGMFFGGDLGLSISRRFNVGLRFNMTKGQEYGKVEKRVYNKVTKKMETRLVDGMVDKYFFTPFIFFSYFF